MVHIHSHHPKHLIATSTLLLAVLIGVGSSTPVAANNSVQSYVVQAATTDLASAAVVRAGGTITEQLAIIDGVVATVDSQALARLRADSSLALNPDAPVQASGGGEETDTEGYLLYPAAATGAHQLHEQKVVTAKTECKEGSDKKWRVNVSSGQEERELQGWGVTVAVIDSGFMQMASAGDWKYKDSTGLMIAGGSGRCIIYRDFLPRTAANENAFKDTKSFNSTDQNGHGTHVAATIGDNRETALASEMNATPTGVAPQANLLIARALGKDGSGSYGDVIKAIEWIIANKTAYNVRVLNLSLYSPVTGPYWADPLNQAVMKAWKAGIVVVAAAGNSGSEAGTITVPGNVPYVVTVGAIKSGRYTDSTYDELAAYSSRGPTESAFVKPDVLVPASRTIAPMPDGSFLARMVSAGAIQEKNRVDFKVGSPAKEHTYYQLSGTSMAAAQVSGIVALMLQKDPRLTNDQVKYRLMGTARTAIDAATGQPTYSVWEQGAGLVNTQQAVFGSSFERANEYMDINADLTTNTHYWGYTTWDQATSEFKLLDPQTGQALAVWGGGRSAWSSGMRTWGGGMRTWGGGMRTWGGGMRTWGGGMRTWGGSDSLWAGSSRAWAGSTSVASLNTAAQIELLVNE